MGDAKIILILFSLEPSDAFFFLSRTRLATATAATATTAVNPTAMDLDIPVDPNEPTYCLCNQVSYGEMVACENPNVYNFLLVYIYLV